MAHSSPERCPGKANFKILREMKTNFLQVKKRPLGKLMSGGFGEQKLKLGVAQVFEYPGQFLRCSLREPQCVHGVGVVAEHERAAHAGAEPETLLPEGRGECPDLDASVQIQRIKAVNWGNRSRRLRRIQIQ